MSIDVPELAELEQVRGRWRSAVAGVLSKSTRKDPEELGDEPERLLETPTYDGIAVRALYTALDELPEPPLPGEWPFVRGADALRDVKSGWKVAEAFPADRVAGVAAKDLNAAVLEALGNGASALMLRVGESGVTAGPARGRPAGRVPEHGAGHRRRGCGLLRRRRHHVGDGGRGGGRSARHTLDRPGRRPAHRVAERPSGACARRGRRGCQARGR